MVSPLCRPSFFNPSTKDCSPIQLPKLHCTITQKSHFNYSSFCDHCGYLVMILKLCVSKCIHKLHYKVMMFCLSNINWNCTYFYAQSFMRFKTLHLIKFFIMQNLTKFEPFNQQQLILLSILVDTKKIVPRFSLSIMYVILCIFMKYVQHKITQHYTFSTNIKSTIIVLDSTQGRSLHICIYYVRLITFFVTFFYQQCHVL